MHLLLLIQIGLFNRIQSVRVLFLKVEMPKIVYGCKRKYKCQSICNNGKNLNYVANVATSSMSDSLYYMFKKLPTHSVFRMMIPWFFVCPVCEGVVVLVSQNGQLNPVSTKLLIIFYLKLKCKHTETGIEKQWEKT